MAPVLIIGGGISGLCLAQALAKLNIAFKVFERDASTNFRSQGYRIRLMAGTDVIKRLTPPCVARLFQDTCAEDPKSMKKYNAITSEPQPSTFGAEARKKLWSSGSPSTVDRTLLRDVLMTDITDNIAFGKVFQRYEVDEEDQSGGVTAYFADGTSERGSLLVGAEGKYSRVARQLAPENVLLDTDVRVFYGKTPLTCELRELSLARGWDGMQVFDDQESLETPMLLFHENICWSDQQREENHTQNKIEVPQDYIYWVLAAQLPSLPWTDEELFNFTPTQAAEAILKLTGRWDDGVRKVLEAQDVSQVAVLKITTASPGLKEWDSSRRVTIIGDAAHAMPPTGASGANTALMDVELLIRQIEKHGAVEMLTVEAVAEYEDEMRRNASQYLSMSLGAAGAMFGQQALEKLRPVTDRW